MPSDELSFIEAARRAQLVRTAVEVIARGGYRKASLGAIASAAGVSVGVIGYHFGNRAGLVQAALTDCITRATAAISPRVTAQTTAGGALRALIEANVEFLVEHPDDLRALTEIIRNGDRDGVVYDAQADIAIRDVQVILHWGLQTGEFRQFDTRVLALAVRACIDALVSLPPGALDPAVAAPELADSFDRATRAATR